MLSLRRRTPRTSRPLAGWSVVATFLLLGIALIVTVWSTRSSVVDASDAVRRGQALALEQAVRADLALLEGPPGEADLQNILREHTDEGLRYISMVEDRELIAAAGSAIPGEWPELTANERFREMNGRLRLAVRRYERLKDGRRRFRVIVEIEPVQADELRSASTVTLGIGAIAAAGLLGVAIVLVLREARRNAMERER